MDGIGNVPKKSERKVQKGHRSPTPSDVGVGVRRQLVMCMYEGGPPRGPQNHESR